MNHRRVKQLLNEKRSKITDRQFFSSRILAGHYEDLAAAQTRRYNYNRRIRVNLFWNTRNPSAACTDNNNIMINKIAARLYDIYLQNGNARNDQISIYRKFVIHIRSDGQAADDC
ncbi:MAG: hypothetical protein II885_17560 [Oscillospiraceae bacterium]|nr:hypothetical protein [Oscillospiraceae bacterium]